ncbi:MAG: hypothetical protein SAMD01599839_23360 [Rectinema sp.]
MLDFRDIRLGEPLCVREAVEQLLSHHIDLFIRRLGAQNHRDEKLKTAVVVQQRMRVRPDGRETPMDFLKKKSRGSVTPRASLMVPFS